MQTYLEQAFGKGDCSSVKMRAAVREWMDLYYGTPRSGEDASARLAVLIVSKLCRTVFAEYNLFGSEKTSRQGREYMRGLSDVKKTAMQYALLGGECLLKMVDGAFVPIRRDCYLPLGRGPNGQLTSVGMMQTLYDKTKKYVLLERRTQQNLDTHIEYRLFEVNGQALGRRVPLDTLPACAMLSDEETLPLVPRLGLGVLADAHRQLRGRQRRPREHLRPRCGADARAVPVRGSAQPRVFERCIAGICLRGPAAPRCGRAARPAGRPVCGLARRPRQRGGDRLQPRPARGQLSRPQAGYFA